MLQFHEAVDKEKGAIIMEVNKNNQRKVRSMKKKALILSGVVISALAVIYLIFSFYFLSHFAFHTTVNHVNVAGNSSARVEEKLAEEMKEYRLTITTRDGETEVLSGENIGIEPVFDGEIQELLKKQNGFAWPYYLLKGQELESKAVVRYDEAACDKELAEFEFMNQSDWVKSENAYVSDYAKGGYEIVKETYGTEIRSATLKKAVSDAISNLTANLNLEEAGCYVEPEVTYEDEQLNKALETLNQYVGVTVVYNVGDEKERLDGEIIHKWLLLEENGSVKIDEEAIAEYVKELAKKYNTAFRKRTLDTSYGQNIQIIGGDYGWKVDNEAEKEMIIKDLKAGEKVERELEYAQTANSHGEHDYGNSYVEINLTAQHLFFYKDGKLLVETDFVSGNLAKNHATPVGAYGLTYKQRDATLRGEDYESDVSYWMPYCGNVGMHDATWRGTFGGSIYKRRGSHGCVNLPVSAAKTIFENIEAGYPVLVYELPGTESAKGQAQDAAWAVDDAVKAIGTVTLDSEAAITAARAAYDALPESAKPYVETLDMLTAAEAALAQLKTDAENQAAATQAQAEAAPVIEQIAAIGAVTEDSGKAIRQARAAYDALSDIAKAYVTNYADLVSAEEAYQSLEES